MTAAFGLWLQQLVSQLGYAEIVLLMALESSGAALVQRRARAVYRRRHSLLARHRSGGLEQPRA